MKSKIYTRKGDSGISELRSGIRVPKNDPRMIALGEIDELNSHLGLVISFLPPDLAAVFGDDIRRIQSELMVLSVNIASGISNTQLVAKGEGRFSLEILEAKIDEMTLSIESPLGFVLPGGCPSVAELHVARAVCRRCERSVVTLLQNKSESVPQNIVMPVLAYLNRLSDYLFILAVKIDGNE